MAEITPELKAQLRACGREVATDLYESAIKTAPNGEVMHNQIRTLTNAAVHLIALQLYNIERQGGVDPRFAFKLVEKEIKDELDWLRNLPPDQLTYSEPEGNTDGRSTETK